LTGLFGKRSVETQRIIDLLTDLTNQVINPALGSAVQSLAGMLAQLTLSVGKSLFSKIQLLSLLIIHLIKIFEI
jgi:hypothetical protein